MAITLASPVTGLPQTGFTSPTYTLTNDVAPGGDGKQFAVTALGGTQTGVTTHAGSSPFTLAFFRAKVYKALGKPDANGLIRSVPKNATTFITRKGVLPLAGQPYATMLIRTVMEVPAGADVADPANVRAALSAHFGAINQQAANIGDTVVNQVL